MKKIYSLLFTMVACASGLVALEWPVAVVKPLSFFGQRSAGVIERGIVLYNEDTVRAAGHGSVLITLEQNSNMDGFPGTLGNAVILAHDDGLLTVYGNLDSADRLGDAVQIDSASILGNNGASGWGKPKTCTFQVIDQVKKTVLNPMLLLPGLKDTHGPIIKDVVVVSSNNQISSLGSVKLVKQGKYRLYADVSDIVDGNNADLSPFRISVLVNGKEYSTIPFELMKEKDGRLYISSPEYTWNALYSDPTRTFLAEIPLTRGRADISVIARDTADNERSVLFGVQIE